MAHLPAFVPYDLRHTFASLLLSCNVPLLYVSKQLGHANQPRRWIIMRSGSPAANSDL
jgi:integrase